MNHLARIFKLLSLLIIILSLNSCRKLIDIFLNRNDLDMRFCNIEKIVTLGPNGEIYNTWDFKYDHLGNPVSIIKTEPGTGSPNFKFTYDSQGRLYQVIGYYLNGGFETWKKFYYNNYGKVLKDTTWAFGVLGDNPDPNSLIHDEHLYEYDTMGRIIKVTTVNLKENSPRHVDNYEYTSEGNLDNNAPYDSMTNINRTHKIWMFLNRDYSKNNPVSAESYNVAKLPLKINSDFSYGFLGAEISRSIITYSCE